ncbi:MAG: ATP-grasp domain-containing protein, partial [Chloroflexi bacterium]|nr:ATP-grasp domain-containing protein [Chloroflexota bacterium]
AADTYLAGDKIINAAQRTGADAIHPGFGFLAENAQFAQACAEADLIFIGPSPESITIMGNKREAKQRMAAIGVPIIPGSGDIDQSDNAFAAAADSIGYPVMVKAAAGGGGKGMRVAASSTTLTAVLTTARREAMAAFGSDELILEKALQHPRHIEVQIFGDQHGNIIHLGERDCSIQRRHQKVIEEAPAVGLSDELRQKLGETAVLAARAVDYVNAGTVEFLLDSDGRFYFLEMNTRIQVEHPVTEMITGQDLVAWQIRVAEGEPLPLKQTDVTFNGHAIEARIYAENPANDFLPVTGDILHWQRPTGNGIRVDDGLLPQDQVTIHYDPMLAKIIARGADRKTAVRRLHRALAQTHLLGLTHNIPFLQDVLQHEVFVQGHIHTHFLQTHFAAWTANIVDTAVPLIAATLAQFVTHPQRHDNAGYWRNSSNRPPIYRYTNHSSVKLTPKGDQFVIEIEDVQITAVLHRYTSPHMTLSVDGHRQQVTLAQDGNTFWVQTLDGITALTVESLLPKPETAVDAGGSLRAPMPGVVLDVLVTVGETVTKGQPLLKLEAMKMEHTIRSVGDGMVTAVYFQPGEQVDADAQLLTIDATT